PPATASRARLYVASNEPTLSREWAFACDTSATLRTLLSAHAQVRERVRVLEQHAEALMHARMRKNCSSINSPIGKTDVGNVNKDNGKEADASLVRPWLLSLLEQIVCAHAHE